MGIEATNAIDVLNASPLSQPSPRTPPPFSNAPETDETVKTPWSVEDAPDLLAWHYLDRQSDEYRTIESGMSAPLPAGGVGQVPAGNVPAVPGTPQIGGVPAVQGTPAIHGTPPVSGAPAVQGTPQAGGASGSPQPAGHALPPHGLAPQAAPSAPGHDWTWEHGTTPAHHQPPRHQQQPMSGEQHEPAHGRRWWRRHEHTQHGLQQKAHAYHTHRTGMTTASKVATSALTRWVLLTLVAVVVLASGGIIFVLASSPALSLTSSGTVSAGGVLQVHGSGFVPGGTITLTIDNGLPATLAAAHPVQGSRDAAGEASLVEMLKSAQARDARGSIVVGLTGTFDANVVAQASWPAGSHVLHAQESNSSRSADVNFTLLAQPVQPAHLVINPTTLDFGTVPQGNKVTESVLISNTGGSPLNWNATTDGSAWLALQNSSGSVQPNGGSQDALYVSVDTGKLSQAEGNATITLHSNGGDTQIPVHVRVGAPVASKQARLNVNPMKLDFGQLSPGQRVTDTLIVDNLGTLALQWQASASGASWLSLDSSSGSIQPGGVPQSVHVTVDTTSSSLQPGSNTASILIHSNGGDATVPVTLTLLPASTPTPTPSPSPTVTPPPTTIPTPSPTPVPVIQVSPGSIDPHASACSHNSDGTYTCAVTVSESTPGNLNWSAPSGVSGTNITFSPPNGQLTPGQTSQQVTIASIPCADYSFTFTDQNNNQATVKWSCTVPKPTGTASLGSCSYSAGDGWSCPLSVAAGASNQVDWPWTATSSGVSGITISPASGSLPPGQSTTANVTIPDMLCPASATITVSGGASTIPLSWSCSATLAVTVNTPTCPADSTNGYTCTVTLSLASGSQGQLNWTSSASNNLPGVSFSPASGTITAGQQTTVNISIPANDCTNGDFYFSGSDGKTVTITWNCPQS